MSANTEDVDLGLAIGFPNCSIRTRLNNSSSGAGVNAKSRADLAFAASDPLSELVWSPRKGLSLKNANSAVADNKPFLLWNVGPSSNPLSPAQYIRTVDDNAVDQGNLSVTQTVLIDSSYMFNDKATSVRPSRKGDGIMEEEVETGDAIPKEEDRRDARDEDLCHPENVHIAAIAEISKKSSGGLDTLANGVSDCEVDMRINGVFSAEFIQKAHCSQSNSIEIYASASGVVGLHVANPSEPIVTKLSEALVCSIPNFHFQKEPDDELTSAAREVTTDKPFYIPPPPLNDILSYAEDDLCNPIVKQNPHLVEGSQKGSRICLDQDKGKEKVLSDEGSSNDEDDSHESVESCKSAGSFSKGVKRRSYDQGLVLESKRMKESIHGSPASASIARPGSSFMNWISNMVKGLPDSNKEDSSSLGLTVACSYDVYDKYSPENFPSKKTNDSAILDMGFQTIFQSLSCRNPTISNNQVEKENDFKGESRELLVADKTSLGDLPRSCDKNNSNSCERIGLPNKEVNPVIVGQASKPWIFSAYIDCSPLACERNLAENKASEERRAIPSDSPGEEMNSTAEGTTPVIPLVMSNVPEKSNPLNSLWITRFSTRAPRLEKCDEITRETNECTTYCPKVNPDRVVDDLLLIDQKSSEARDACAGIERFDANAEVTVDIKSTSELCPIPPSQEIRSSEAMASLFARRVDALRHIGPSKGRNNSTSLVMCFFCGSGHDLRECPDVTKSELEDLLLKMSSFDRSGESSCLCIRCSGSDHWAISCPVAPSSNHLRSKQSAFSFPSHWTLNANGYPSKRTESSLGNGVKTNPSSSPSNIGNAQDTVALSEVFHAIKNLRLSRADILRWMNSDVSLSHLNGFFLRLRLGKLEAGLGEASYYVACITGDAREHNGCSSKKSILVDVGGIRSSVGSQFVSNQDFLEEEIKAWWCRTVDSGRKIPSLDELNSKLNHRKILGF